MRPTIGPIQNGGYRGRHPPGLWTAGERRLPLSVRQHSIPGDANGIRTRDPLLEREVSLTARRSRHAGFSRTVPADHLCQHMGNAPDMPLGRDEKIRTSDPSLPKRVPYRWATSRSADLYDQPVLSSTYSLEILGS